MTTTDPDAAAGQVIPSTPTQSEPGAAGVFTHRQILVILSGLMSGMLLAALDMTIVSTSIRTIADDLNGLSLQAWATTAYLITSTIATPLYGKLSDLYGRRPFFITAISVFVAGSLLSGFATSMYQLAAFRAVQGIGAGGLFSLALAIIGDIVPPRERARYQGYMLAVFGSASVLGPLVGGFFAGQSSLLGITGWRWVFLINVPIGALALVLVARVLHLPHTRRDHAIDWPGAVALSICLVPLLLVAEQGRTWGWLSGGAIACYAVGAVGFVLFLLSERHYGDDALLPLRLFTGRTFAIGSLMNLFIGMGMFGGMAALPLYLQIVRGHTPTESGLLMLPLTAGVMSGSVLSGQFIARTGRYKIFPVMGCMLLVTGMLLFSLVHLDTSIWAVAGISVVFGLGLGFNMQTLVLAIQNAVPPQDMGVATGSATFFRQMGGTLGTAVFLSVLFSTVGGNIKDAIGSTVKANPSLAPDFAKLQGASLDDSSFINKLSDQLAAPFKKGFTDSIDLVFTLGAAVLVVALITVFFLPEEPLRTKSGLAAREDAARENEAAAQRGATS
ncbi:MDR family MFS transporter [Spongisporangium articulatum]|uniref:MDR family MFS transporter n=1 Tax=Spongisporangium articulatum TaxID=3362603 RepID=A0ABW8AHV5_9ACTN